MLLNNRDVLQLLLLYDKSSLYSGFFQGIYSIVKQNQKFNLHLSSETQFSHRAFSTVDLKVFELNLSQMGTSYKPKNYAKMP